MNSKNTLGYWFSVDRGGKSVEYVSDSGYDSVHQKHSIAHLEARRFVVLPIRHHILVSGQIDAFGKDYFVDPALKCHGKNLALEVNRTICHCDIVLVDSSKFVRNAGSGPGPG